MGALYKIGMINDYIKSLLRNSQSKCYKQAES